MMARFDTEAGLFLESAKEFERNVEVELGNIEGKAAVYFLCRFYWRTTCF